MTTAAYTDPHEFTALDRPRLAAVRTPCTAYWCAHVAAYGKPHCCPAFAQAVKEWANAEAERLLPGGYRPGSDRWIDVRGYIHWSGGTASLPMVSVQRRSPGGWHNGCQYGGQETEPGSAVTMPGFSAVREGI